MENKNRRIIIYILPILLLALIICLAIVLLHKNNDNDKAVLTIDNPTYSATFIVDGVEYKTINIKDGYITDFPYPPAKDGYIFDCWELDGKKFNITNRLDSNAQIFAKYIKVEVGSICTVVFNPDNGEEEKKIQVGSGVQLQLPKDPKKNGYQFIGWYDNDQKFDTSSTVSKDLVLVAKYIDTNYTENHTIIATNNTDATTYSNYINSYTNTYSNSSYINNYNNDVQDITTNNVIPTYKITLKYNNSSNDISINIKEGNLFNQPSAPQKHGYTFIGWYEGNSKINFPITINRNIVLEAKYTSNYSTDFSNTSLRNIEANVKSNSKTNAIFEDRLYAEKSTLSIVNTNTIIGDFNNDGKLTVRDYNLFKSFLNDSDHQITTYIKDNMDLFDDNIIDNKDLNLLNLIIVKNFTILYNEELEQFKKDNNINNTNNIVVLKTEDLITGHLFNVYLVINYDTSYNDMDKIELFTQKILREMAKIDFNILGLLKKYNTNLVIFGSYDCDNALISVGHFTYSGYCNSINRNIVIPYRSYVLSNYYSPKEIIHETGHALDFTLRHILINDLNGGITGLSDYEIIHSSTLLRRLFLFEKTINPYSWSELAALDAVNLKTNFNNFSAYTMENLQSRPHEYFAEIFKNYYYSTSTKNLVRRLAPTSYRAFETIISNIDKL